MQLKKILGVALLIFLICVAISLCYALLTVFKIALWEDDALYGFFYRTERDGVVYREERYSDEISYVVVEFSKSADGKDSIYIPDEVNGKPVLSIGTAAKAGPAELSADVDRVYLPWSAATYNITDINGVDTVISSNVNSLYFKRSDAANEIYVLPRITYEGKNLSPYESLCIPANVAYFFNYEGCPNEGYFFVDLLEESGKLARPPYDPKRDGYVFGGWYTDKECTDAWSFEDTITISCDENGERIYEEIKLYAKWCEQP